MKHLNNTLVCLLTALGFCSLVPIAHAQGPLSPTVIFTTDAQTPSITGAANVDAGDSPADSDFYIRERRNGNEVALRISSFLNFDVSSLTPQVVNESGFAVLLSADYEFRLNDINSAAAIVGRVTNGAWNGTSVRPLHSWGITDSADRSPLVADIASLTPSPTASVSVDVTDIVRGWVNGTVPNYGLAVFMDRLEFNGAGFSNPRLVMGVSSTVGPVIPFTDTDGDSYRDEAEIAFGSNPSDASSVPAFAAAPSRPNVVIIYADDLGLGDVSVYGDAFGTSSPAITPNMDALAANGVMFTQAHSGNGTCTQSRYGLLTGKYNWREFDGISMHYGMHSSISDLPLPSDTTIAEYLKTQGYDTAAFGKWHLGGRWHAPDGSRITGNPSNPTSVDWDRPVERHAVDNGFDFYRGLSTTINFGPYVYMHNDRNQLVSDTNADGVPTAFREVTANDTMTFLTNANLNSSVLGARDSRSSLGDPAYRQIDAGPVMINDFEEYIANRETANDTDPFFSYVALYSPHTPWAITPAFATADQARGFGYADFMREVDNRIGRVIAAIDDAGFGDNTMIILTSDNGPENIAMQQSLSFGRDPNGPLRGNKRDSWEGGTRVPFIVRWPGQAAAGLRVNQPIWQGDIFTTVAAFLNQELPDTTAPDGESFLNLIRGQAKPDGSRPAIVLSSIRGDLSLKTNDGWKLIDSDGGGHNISWDADNVSLSNPAGTNRANPKQLFQLDTDLGETDNLIGSIFDDPTIRSELTAITGIDLLAELDVLRVAESASLFTRVPDNDGDQLPNVYEIANGLNPNSSLDAAGDLDSDGFSNLDEFIADTDPNDPSDPFLQGDNNSDGVVDCDDLDSYVGNIGLSSSGALAQLDLDDDGIVSAADADIHVLTLIQTSNGVVGTFLGDLNCDGRVDVLNDALALVLNLGGVTTRYAQGDLNFDGGVSVLGDAVLLIANLNNSNAP